MGSWSFFPETHGFLHGARLWKGVVRQCPPPLQLGFLPGLLLLIQRLSVNRGFGEFVVMTPAIAIRAGRERRRKLYGLAWLPTVFYAVEKHVRFDLADRVFGPFVDALCFPKRRDDRLLDVAFLFFPAGRQ